MSSSAKVAITLGQNRQVVKRARPVSGADHLQVNRRERLGCNTNQYKHQRMGNDSFILDDSALKGIQMKSSHQVDGTDFRLLLTKQRESRNIIGFNGVSCVDLREKLSRNKHVRRSGRVADTSDTLGRLPPIRSETDSLHLDLSGNSQDRFRSTSKALSPRRIRSALYTRETTVGSNATKPNVQDQPSANITPKNKLQAKKPLTVSSLLHSLGLEKYEILFQAQEVDMTALKQMKDNELKEIGIPMGPRKKILHSILS